MSLFFKLLILLQTKMKTPVPYGWFHIMWLVIVFGYVVILYFIRNKN